jgi:hypothetical protein
VFDEAQVGFCSVGKTKFQRFNFAKKKEKSYFRRAGKSGDCLGYGFNS